MAYAIGGQILGVLKGASMNTTNDQAIPITAANYIIRRIVVVNASGNPGVQPSGGIYTALSKGGTTVVGNSQTYNGLTSALKFFDLTLTATCGTDAFTDSILYFSLSVAKGGAGVTVDIYVYGDIIL